MVDFDHDIFGSNAWHFRLLLIFRNEYSSGKLFRKVNYERRERSEKNKGGMECIYVYRVLEDCFEERDSRLRKHESDLTVCRHSKISFVETERGKHCSEWKKDESTSGKGIVSMPTYFRDQIFSISLEFTNRTPGGGKWRDKRGKTNRFVTREMRVTS